MRNYNLEPLIIEDGEYKLNNAVLYVTFGVFVIGSIVITYLQNHFPVKQILINNIPIQNKASLSFWPIMIANFASIMAIWAKKYFLPGQKNKSSYFYFENQQIVQKNKDNIIKAINIKDIKILKKSFKHPDFFPIDLDSEEGYISFISKTIVICFVFLACVFIFPKYFMYIIMFATIFVIIIFFFPLAIFRSFNGLNLDIFKNYVLIQTDNNRIILLNLKKQEFGELEEYFRNFNIEIKG